MGCRDMKRFFPGHTCGVWPQSWESNLGLSGSVAQASLSPASAPLNHFPATAVIRGSTLPPSSPQGRPQSPASVPQPHLGWP